MRNHSVPDEDLIFAVSQAASADKKREKKGIRVIVSTFSKVSL